jgi:hypothetical protein
LLFIDPTATEVLSRASYDAIGPPLGAWQCWAVVFALVVFVVVARMVVVRLGVAHGSHHEQIARMSTYAGLIPRTSVNASPAIPIMI